MYTVFAKYPHWIAPKAGCCIALVVWFLFSSLSFSKAAQNPPSTIDLKHSGAEISLKLAGVPRREAIARILAEGDVTVEWRDEALAIEPITGEYHGSTDKVLVLLLDGTNFILTYKFDVDELKISRLLVLGPVEPLSSFQQSEGTHISRGPPRPRETKNARERRLRRARADDAPMRRPLPGDR